MSRARLASVASQLSAAAAASASPPSAAKASIHSLVVALEQAVEADKAAGDCCRALRALWAAVEDDGRRILLNPSHPAWGRVGSLSSVQKDAPALEAAVRACCRLQSRLLNQRGAGEGAEEDDDEEEQLELCALLLPPLIIAAGPSGLQEVAHQSGILHKVPSWQADLARGRPRLAAFKCGWSLCLPLNNLIMESSQGVRTATMTVEDGNAAVEAALLLMQTTAEGGSAVSAAYLPAPATHRNALQVRTSASALLSIALQLHAAPFHHAHHHHEEEEEEEEEEGALFFERCTTVVGSASASESAAVRERIVDAALALCQSTIGPLPLTPHPFAQAADVRDWQRKKHAALHLLSQCRHLFPRHHAQQARLLATAVSVLHVTDVLGAGDLEACKDSVDAATELLVAEMADTHGVTVGELFRSSSQLETQEAPALSDKAGGLRLADQTVQPEDEALPPTLLPPTLLSPVHWESLRLRGFAVVDNFLSAERAGELATSLSRLADSKQLVSPGQSNRDDVVMFLSRHHQEAIELADSPSSSAADNAGSGAPPAGLCGRGSLQHTMASLCDLHRHMATRLYLTGGCEYQAAVYSGAGSAGFRKHRDELPIGADAARAPAWAAESGAGPPLRQIDCARSGSEDDDDLPRRITAICYAENGWQPGNGGCLRLYLEDTGLQKGQDKGGEVIDIEPLAGRLVVFASGGVVHEVMPIVKGGARGAVTAWFH